MKRGQGGDRYESVPHATGGLGLGGERLAEVKGREGDEMGDLVGVS